MMPSSRKAARPNNPAADKREKSNVQVAVRIRPVISSEKGETVVVKGDSKQKNVAIKAKSFGPFDKVYLPTSTQTEIYHDLVAPQVEDVLRGYNCTIFAYGQTGTGKTFTMEGGNAGSPEVDWETDEETGIVPRAVQHMFSLLQQQQSEEYVVRVSYVELYNEELFDLLSPSNPGQSTGYSGLRIYEDPSKKGSVIISGAEEVPVRTRGEVYKLLKRGGEKRRTAETLMNHSSSRSHSVFTISVVVREMTPSGEELVKQGKLHLVDLAGSENIGRSGAEGKRAKEAGQINTSLLTLGRVITALTTGAPHVPYRESKLTRLLQDSLGGSTITTLIATLSPTSCNYEESHSTLEYAQRAKNIRNHPEINQKLSKKDLFKEYATEIEKLKKDLRAAREKNGVYLEQETLDGMESHLREQNKEIDELTEKLEDAFDRMNRFMADMQLMDHNYRLAYGRMKDVEERLKKRIAELEEATMHLAQTKKELAETKEVLEDMRVAAVEQQSDAKKFRKTALAAGTRCDQLHEKIGRMTNSELENLKRAMEALDVVEQTGPETIDDVTEAAAKVTSLADSALEQLVNVSSATAIGIQESRLGLEAIVGAAKESIQELLDKTIKNGHELQADLKKMDTAMTTKMARITAQLTNLKSMVREDEVARQASTSKIQAENEQLRQELAKWRSTTRDSITTDEQIDADNDEQVQKVLEQEDMEIDKLAACIEQLRKTNEQLRTTKEKNASLWKNARERKSTLRSGVLTDTQQAEKAHAEQANKIDQVLSEQRERTQKVTKQVLQVTEAVEKEESDGVESLSSSLTASSNLIANHTSLTEQSVQEAVTKLNSRTEEQAARMESVGDEMAKGIAETSQLIVKQKSQIHSDISDVSGKIQETTEKVTTVIQSMKTCADTGETPKKKPLNLREIRELKSVDELFEGYRKENDNGEGDENKFRRSHFRVRDSVLNPDEAKVPLSPGGIRQRLQESGAIQEEATGDDSGASFGKDTSNATR